MPQPDKMPVATGFSISEAINSLSLLGWAVVIILGLMALYLLAVSIERQIFFSKNKSRSRAFALALRELFSTHGARSLTMLGDMPKANLDSTLGQVVSAAGAAFSAKREGVDALDVVVGINRAVERTIERQTTRMKRGFGGLATIASTAPFVGLFGTVVGIINAFAHMKASGGEGGMGVVSGAISEALATTALGLFVAIPAVALYNHFTNAVDHAVVDMDEVSSEMVEAVVLSKK